MVSSIFENIKLQFNRLSRINKYSIAFAAFIVWMSFFDSRSFTTQYSLSKTIYKLEKDKKHYEEQLQVALQDKEELENNKEKFAREKFLFHKENEEIIIIQNQD